MGIADFLLAEARRHPSVMPQDMVKLCYQAAFGAEHGLSDVSRALAYFNEEYDATLVDDKPLIECIGPMVCRVNMSAWKRLELDPVWLWNLFVASVSGAVQQDSKACEYSSAPVSSTASLSCSATAEVGLPKGSISFDCCIAEVEILAQAEALPFSIAQWYEYIRGYNGGPVRHSEKYRENEKPAYRIATGWTAAMLPVFEGMTGRDGGVIAIDGRAAAGKSTFAKRLAKIIAGDKSIVAEMDHFFLPPKLRTVERLATPGGNIHSERFVEEVLPMIGAVEEFSYRRFDCASMDYNGTIAIDAHLWRIVEGVYSCHPIFGNYMNIRVFLDVDPETQRVRIEKRNNPKIAADYLAKWISMEETYFETYDIRESADMVLRM